MKKKFIAAIFLFLSFILAGCSANIASVKSSSGAAVTASPSASAVSVSPAEKRDTAQQNLKPVKPGTQPPLTSSQKSQVNDKISSAINNIDSSLNSLEDAKDINLSSVN
jgi:PBP1b-binding outer membrane lipoprotein LpoB